MAFNEITLSVLCNKKDSVPIDGGLSSPAAYLPITPLHLLMHGNIH
jgi:hypothetical protein